MGELFHFFYHSLPIAGVDPITWAIYAVYAIAIGFAYAGMRQAQKAAKRASQFNTQNRQRGALYQVRGGAIPRRLIYGRQRVGGIEAYVAVGGTENEYLHYILIWGEGPCEEVERLLFEGNGISMRNITMPGISDDPETPEDESVPGEEVPGILVPTDDSPYAGHVRLESELGDQFPPSPHGQDIIPGWGPKDLLVGICYSWVELKYDENIFPTGVPNIGAIIKGRKDIWDPRESVVKFTNNPALCLAHYMCLPKLGPGLDYETELGEDELIAAANICEEILAVPGPHASSGIVLPSVVPSVPATDGTIDLEFRYTFDGLVELNNNTEDIIEDFRMAMAGITTYIGGKFRIYAGAYIVPTFTIDKTMLVGPVARRTKASRRDRLTGIRGVYAGEFTRWVPTDFPALIPAEYVEADGGEELVDDIELLNSKSPHLARRVASIFLKRSRYSREVSIQCNILAWQAQAGLTVFFDFPEIGFDNVPMDVSQMAMKINKGEVIIEISLRETSPLIYLEPEYTGGLAIPSDKVLPRPIIKPPEYIDLFVTVPALVFIECKSRDGDLVLCGFAEFIPTVPPKKYKNRQINGSLSVSRFDLIDCEFSGSLGGGSVGATFPCFYFVNEFASGTISATPVFINEEGQASYLYAVNWSPVLEGGNLNKATTNWRVTVAGTGILSGGGVVHYGVSGSPIVGTCLVSYGGNFEILLEVQAISGFGSMLGQFKAGIYTQTDNWNIQEHYDENCEVVRSAQEVTRSVFETTFDLPEFRTAIALGRPDVYYQPIGTYYLGAIEPIYTDVLTTPTQRRTVSREGCLLGTGFGVISAQANGEITEQLSVEDTEEEAIRRFQDSHPWSDYEWVNCGTIPCCESEYRIRTGDSFYYKEARGGIRIKGLTSGKVYLVTVYIDKKSLAYDTIQTKAFSHEVMGIAEPTGVLFFEFDLPTERGFVTYISQVVTSSAP